MDDDLYANRLLPVFDRAPPARGGERAVLVNEDFPNAVTNDARFIFFGTGVEVPIRQHLSAFGDIRLLVGAEGRDADGLLAILPLRFGMAWRF